MSGNIISVAELREKLKKKQDILLIDVRTQQEKDMFDLGGILIPHHELPEKLSSVDKEKEIITYCHTGARSMLAAKTLQEAGFKCVRSLAGGIMAWQAEEVETVS